MITKFENGELVDEHGEIKQYRDDNAGFARWDQFLEKMKVRGLTPDGREVNDGVPMEPPIGYVQPPDLMDSIRQMVRSELLRRAADEEGFESEEEANDFEMDEGDGDSWEALTPYEQAELEGMSARREAEAVTAGVMTSPVGGAPEAPGEPSGSPAAPSSVAAVAEVPPAPKSSL